MKKENLKLGRTYYTSNGNKANPPISWGRLVKINPKKAVLERNGKQYKRKITRLRETPEEAVRTSGMRKTIREYIKEVERNEAESLLSSKQQRQLKQLGNNVRIESLCGKYFVYGLPKTYVFSNIKELKQGLNRLVNLFDDRNTKIKQIGYKILRIDCKDGSKKYHKIIGIDFKQSDIIVKCHRQEIEPIYDEKETLGKQDYPNIKVVLI